VSWLSSPAAKEPQLLLYLQLSVLLLLLLPTPTFFYERSEDRLYLLCF
jgi:hypothetical protein